MRLLVKLCRELQQTAEDEPFYLSDRVGGNAIGVSPMTVWRYLKTLVADEILVVTEPGRKQRATRYRYCKEL